MFPEIVHIWGPFSIHSYGVMILIGILLFSWLLLRDPRRLKLISLPLYVETLSLAVFVAIIGGRVVSIATTNSSRLSFEEIVAPWQGGFSVLGAILGILVIIPWYLRRHKLHVLSIMDLAATYAPLLQAIARLGCFFAGCCYGMPTTQWWGVSFLDSYGHRLHGIAVHPTQLYSAVLLSIIFIIMYGIVRLRVNKPGVATAIYLLLMSLERFAVDFWRGDREFFPFSSFISSNQFIALCLCALSGVMLITLLVFDQHGKKHQ